MTSFKVFFSLIVAVAWMAALSLQYMTYPEMENSDMIFMWIVVGIIILALGPLTLYIIWKEG